MHCMLLFGMQVPSTEAVIRREDILMHIYYVRQVNLVDIMLLLLYVLVCVCVHRVSC